MWVGLSGFVKLCVHHFFCCYHVIMCRLHADSDECQTPGRCAAGQECVNLYGTFTCTDVGRVQAVGRDTVM